MMYGASQTPTVYGKLIAGVVTVCYLGSNIFYYKAGKAYKKLMIEKDALSETSNIINITA